MEETFRTHKDVPFGWFDMLLKAVTRDPKMGRCPTPAAAARFNARTPRGRTA